MRSAVIARSAQPPRFVVSVFGTPLIALEFATAPEYFPPAQPSLPTITPQKGRTSTGRLVYFSTATGLYEPASAGRDGLRVAPLILQPGRYGVHPKAGPAGTVQVTYVLHPAIWGVWSAADGPDRIYYRALTYSGVDRDGKPAMPVTLSWQRGVPAVERPPFIFIRRERASGPDGPPAGRPSLTIAERPKLRLVGAGDGKSTPLRVEATATETSEKARKGVSTGGISLRGINLSQLQHRHFNWGKPYSGQNLSMAGSDGTKQAKDVPTPSTRWLESAGITPELIKQIRSWKCDVIRVPINQDWVLNGITPRQCEDAAPMPGEQYLRDLDQLIAWAADAGMYTMLTVHTLRHVPFSCARGTEYRYQGHLPDELSAVCWSLLNERYRNTNAVLFDLFNEPYPITQDDKFSDCYTGIRPIGTAAGKTLDWYELWHHRVRELAEHIHSGEFGDPQRVLFVTGMGGPARGVNLRHMPVRKIIEYGRAAPASSKGDRLTAPGIADANSREKRSKPALGPALKNLVYCPHVYCNGCESLPAGDSVKHLAGDSIEHWLDIDPQSERLGELKERGPADSVAARVAYPVFVAEWGPAEAGVLKDGSWNPDPKAGQVCPKNLETQQKRVQRLAGFLTSGQVGATAKIVGWTAWAIGDKPHLDLRDERGLRDLLEPRSDDDLTRSIAKYLARKCAEEFWDGLPKCKGVNVPETTHPYLVIDGSGARRLTAWGEFVTGLLTGKRASLPKTSP